MFAEFNDLSLCRYTHTLFEPKQTPHATAGATPVTGPKKTVVTISFVHHGDAFVEAFELATATGRSP